MDTILSSFASTNDALSSYQQAFLQSERDLLSKKMKALDEQIARLQQQHAELANQHDQCSSILSPMRRLPNEILLEIFTKFQASDHQSVLDISHVCRRWRNMVHDIPSLWTDLVVPTTNRQGQPAEFSFIWERLEHYAERAQGHPLTFKMEGLSDTLTDEILREMFAEDCDGLPGPPTYSSLSIDATDFDTIQLFLTHYETLGRDPSDLISFSLTSSEVNVVNLEPTDVLDFTSLANLREFRLDVKDFFFLDERVVIDWSLLTSLTLRTRLLSVEYLKIIANCPALESLDIAPDDDDEDWEKGVSITLKNLCHLAINAYFQPSTLLKRLICPVLEELTFTFPGPMNKDNDPISTFLNNLTGGLRIFRCSADVFPVALKTSAGFAKLTSLTIGTPYDESYEYGDANVFECLVQERRGTSRLLPLLERLEVLDHPPFSLEMMTSCETMINSRSKACIPPPAPDDTRIRTLQSVIISENLELGNQESVLESLRLLNHFREQGVLVGLF